MLRERALEYTLQIIQIVPWEKSIRVDSVLQESVEGKQFPKESEAKREHKNTGCRTELQPKQMELHGNKPVGMWASCPWTALKREPQSTDSGSSVCHLLKYPVQCPETGEQ